jgi:hypothetical protein
MQTLAASAALAPGGLRPEHLQGGEPRLWRGLVRDWPAVQAALAVPARPEAILDVLAPLDVGASVGAWRAPAAIDGRFGYSEDFAGFNFTRELLPFAQVLQRLRALMAEPEPEALYVGSTTIDTTAPGFRTANDLPAPLLQALQPLASLWLGNRGQVAIHHDLPDNLACVVAGRRRFVLFPPDAVGDLYIGPLEHTLAGQPTSLVDPRAPDFTRFPRYARALERGFEVELGPGDALFIPSLWWHGVASLAPVNLLVNYWWRGVPEHMDSPMGALLHTLLTVRDLPAHQRAAWRALFEHYVFEAGEHTAAHLPEPARQVLAPLTPATARGLRARILRRLNR